MPTKVIGIDGNEANVTQRVGSNVFAYELILAMDKYLQSNPLFEVVVYLSRPPLADLPAVRPGWRYQVVLHKPFWGQWRLPLELWRRRQVDLFFSPGHYLPSLSPVPMVSTIMDLAFEKFPSYFRRSDLYQLKLFTRWGVKQAKHLMAISEATKQDLLALYHQPAEKITVVYPAVKPVVPLAQVEVGVHLKKLNQDKPYLLFIGTLQPRKNLVRLIESFAWLRDQGFPGELVLAGKIGWQAEEILAALENSPVKDHIRHLGFVDNLDKQALVQGAEMLILPGLYEGFGLPPLEAIQLGTLPVVSDLSSLPEVVPIRDLRFDPNNAVDIGETILRVWQQPDKQRQAWLKELQAEAEKFDWAKSAELTCHQLHQLSQ